MEKKGSQWSSRIAVFKVSAGVKLLVQCYLNIRWDPCSYGSHYQDHIFLFGSGVLKFHGTVLSDIGNYKGLIFILHEELN